MARPVPNAVIDWINTTQGFLTAAQYGAVGNGVVDDTEAVQSLLNAVAGTGRTAFLPHGNYKCGALDARRVKNIRMDGYITSTVTSGAGIVIGTETNTNVDHILGTIQIRIQRSSNAGAEGTDGIRIRGIRDTSLRLMAQGFDVGVAVRPTRAGTQYVAFNSFEQVYTYGCRTGLLLELDLTGGVYNPFINENVWNNIVITEGNNTLSGDSQGVVMLTGNNNLFVKPQLELLDIPIWIKAGSRNRFTMCRLEAAGSVLFGDGTAANVAGENIVTSAYAQTNLYAPAGTQQSPALNFCLPESGPIWTEMYVGTAAETIVPVVVGDIIDLDVGVTGTPTNVLTVTALDASEVALSSLSAGEMPYIGSLLSSVAHGSSGTSAAMTISAVHYPIGKRFVGPCRSEVKFLKIETVGGVTYEWLAVRKLVRNMGVRSSPLKVEAE